MLLFYVENTFLIKALVECISQFPANTACDHTMRARSRKTGPDHRGDLPGQVRGRACGGAGDQARCHGGTARGPGPRYEALRVFPVLHSSMSPSAALSRWTAAHTSNTNWESHSCCALEPS